MKTIEIRFVEKIYSDTSKHYLAQSKKWYGWRYIGTNESSLDNWYDNYIENTKDKLLETILTKHFKTCKKFVTIIEHPSLKIY